MRYCDWDEVLDRDGLLILTEEALTPPRRSRAPMRRLAAAAACAGLVLGLMNYRAVAAGVGELCRYFAGIGATADDKAELWVLEEPVTWTEGDWTYEADATLRSGVLELELTMSSPLPADQLPSPVKLRLGLSADGEPLHNAVHTITPYSVADAGEGSGYPRYRLEQGPLYDGRPAAGGLRPPCQRSGRPGGSVLPPTGAGRDAPHGTEDLDAPPGGYDHLGGGGRLSHIRQLRQHRVVGLALRHLLYRRIGRALSLPRHHRRL